MIFNSHDKESNGGKHPVTYADIWKDAIGHIKPLETALTDKRDLLSTQSLDYII